jgi:hypothetical protein
MLSQCQVQWADISKGDLPKDPASPHINSLLTRHFIPYPDAQCSPSHPPRSPLSHLHLLSLPTPKCARSALTPIILGGLSPETPRSYLAPVSAACRSMPSAVCAGCLLRVYNSYGGQTCCYDVSCPKVFSRSCGSNLLPSPQGDLIFDGSGFCPQNFIQNHRSCFVVGQ